MNKPIEINTIFFNEKKNLLEENLLNIKEKVKYEIDGALNEFNLLKYDEKKFNEHFHKIKTQINEYDDMIKIINNYKTLINNLEFYFKKYAYPSEKTSLSESIIDFENSLKKKTNPYDLNVKLNSILSYMNNIIRKGKKKDDDDNYTRNHSYNSSYNNSFSGFGGGSTGGGGATSSW